MCVAGAALFFAGFRRELAGLTMIGALVGIFGLLILVSIVDGKYK